MTDFRQKQGDAASAADIEFRRGLEELVRDHLDGCMTAALASCSSAHDTEDDDDAAATEGVDLLVRRRRRVDLEGDDLAESSAARRRHSRILSRWVARHAEEMITTIERRNRETELMALAGLHTVSMLDSSFLRESRRSAPSGGGGAADRPTAVARASSILQRWRELEDESTGRQRRNVSGSNLNRNDSEGRADTSESEENDYAQWTHGRLRLSNGHGEEDEEEEDRRSSREPSPDLGEGERERVRQIVRGWMTESGMIESGSQISSQRNESSRAEWLGETERERVRLAREWVQMASQQRDVHAGRREDRNQEQNQDQGGRDGSVTDHEEGQPEHIRRDLLRLRGRQARLDLIMRIMRERQRELQGLSEHRAVSDFAHRNRIQSLLRGRFLRNGTPTEEERPPSMAERELGQLRQRHPVSGLREGFRFRLENIVRGQVSSNSDPSANHNISGSRNDLSQLNTVVELTNDDNEQSHSRSENNDAPQMLETQTGSSVSSTTTDNIDWHESVAQEGHWQEENTEHQRSDGQQSTEMGFNEWHDETGEGSDGNWQENVDPDWSQETPGNEDGEDSHLAEVREEWNEDVSTAENWQDGLFDPSRSQRSIPIRRANRFIPPDDDNVYSMELRELLSRRSVSNLLHSGFRESLDQLIQSYVQRQGRSPLDWDLQRNLTTPAPQDEDQDQQRDDLNGNQQDPLARPPLVLPSPPVPPPQPLWHQEMHHSNWTRHSMHRSEIEWDIINDLRGDMARLQQGMSHMQRMLEACMDMQLELQRSVRQEVSAALNRSSGAQGLGEESSEDGSKWGHVRKGTCCICCDNHIDSLLYRCGHMCTCSKCANELVGGGGKCPLCRAPIVEVIRAYSIL